MQAFHTGISSGISRAFVLIAAKSSARDFPRKRARKSLSKISGIGGVSARKNARGIGKKEDRVRIQMPRNGAAE